MGFRSRGVVIGAWYIKRRPRWMTTREFLLGFVTWSSLALLLVDSGYDVAAAGLVQDEGWANGQVNLTVGRPHGMPGCILLISMAHLQHRLFSEGASTDLEPYGQSQ